MTTWDRDNPLALAEALGETPRANQALADYYALGPARSLDALLKSWQKDSTRKAPTRHTSVVGGWSREYHWQERVARAQELETKARQDLERRIWAERRAEMRDKLHLLADKMAARASEMLDAALYSDKVTREKQVIKDGVRVVEQTIIRQPVKWSASDAAKFGATATQLAKLATGLTEAPAVNLNVTPDEIAGMSDEDLAALIERLKTGVGNA